MSGVTEDGSYVTDEFVSYVRPLIQGDVSPVNGRRYTASSLPSVVKSRRYQNRPDVTGRTPAKKAGMSSRFLFAQTARQADMSARPAGGWRNIRGSSTFLIPIYRFFGCNILQWAIPVSYT